MKKNIFKYSGYKWLFVMLLLAALMIAVIIYYNRRIKIINDKLKESSAMRVPGSLQEEKRNSKHQRLIN
jgi:hypothetical protein